MKTSRILLAGALLCALTTGFAACDDDDDDKPARPVTGVMTKIDFDVDDDILEIADVYVDYTDFSGRTRQEKLTGSGDWERQASTTTLPATISYSLDIRPLDLPAYTRQTYDIEIDAEFAAVAYYNGEASVLVSDNVPVVLFKRENVPASEVKAVLTQAANTVKAAMPIAYRFTYTPDGLTILADKILK